MNKLKSILTDTLYVGLGSAIIITRTAVKVVKNCRNEGKQYLEDEEDERFQYEREVEYEQDKIESERRDIEDVQYA